VEGNPKLAMPDLTRSIERQLTDGKWTRLESPTGNSTSHSSRGASPAVTGNLAGAQIDSTADAGRSARSRYDCRADKPIPIEDWRSDATPLVLALA
jgi:hypothetical protein